MGAGSSVAAKHEKAANPEVVGANADGDGTSAAAAKDTGSESKALSAHLEKLLKFRDTWQAGRHTFYSWHSQTVEDALEPELEIVDSHHHLWDMRELQGYNLFGLFKQQYYMTDELVEEILGSGHNVTHTVYIEAHSFHSVNVDAVMKPLGEVRMAQGVAAQFASGKYGSTRAVGGIVGTADLLKHGVGVEPLLAACKSTCSNYRGIRVSGHFDGKVTDGFRVGEPGIYGQPKFREGFALLEKFDLVFDAFVFASQLQELHALATAFPGITIVMDHMGAPPAALGNYEKATGYNDKQEDILAQWKRDMTRIAKECPNVNVKVGGFIPQLGHGFDGRAKPPSSEEVAAVIGDMCLCTIRAFGCGRCMLESNFPVDKCGVSYTVLWNAFKRITKVAGFSDDERKLLFSGTAKRVYRL
ncbi:unnamed protein product [Prorocentrum cordatum]|uniref:Amidohydrolase-related domain-containing protein n=1 Tax=Prorocentrum cordatum TaxID=2364126 RepID=A0ABN9Q0K6_9DINO|nr:unnamed protein product [Polarella glacialis]